MRETGIWMRFCLTCLVLPLGAQVIARPTVWDFESDRGDWRPRSATMMVERAADLGAAIGGRACLHVRGSMSENWNYALLETVPLQAGRLYRLSAWVQVTSASSKTPMPFLKCEFVAADRNREIGRAATDAFDAARLGQWQHLTREFHALDKVGAGRTTCGLGRRSSDGERQESTQHQNSEKSRVEHGAPPFIWDLQNLVEVIGTSLWHPSRAIYPSLNAGEKLYYWNEEQ